MKINSSHLLHIGNLKLFHSLHDFFLQIIFYFAGDFGTDTVKSSPKSSLVFDETIQLTPYATVSVFRCPVPVCSKPCVTLRAFRMHAKCVHKDNSNIEPLIQEATANFICKVRGTYRRRVVQSYSCALEMPYQRSLSSSFEVFPESRTWNM